MNYYKCLSFVAAACLSLSAHADLKNISSTSLQSNSQEAIACSIIQPGGVTYEGFKVLVAFSEGATPDSNPYLRVESLGMDLVYENDDWQGNQYLNGQPVLDASNAAGSALVYEAGLGRVPNRPSDSGLFMLFLPGDAVCAHSRERQGADLKQVSVSLTDITSLVYYSQKSLGTSERLNFLLEKLKHQVLSR